MDLAKKIITYSLGVIALLLVLVLVFAGYLVLVPNSDLFGYHYLSSSSAIIDYDEYTDAFALANYEKIEVESHGFDIELYPQDEKMDRIMVTFKKGAKGFTSENIKSISYQYAYSDVTKTISIKVIEPKTGFMIYDSSYIKIGIPDTSNEKEVKVTSAGGTITFGEETPFGALEPLTFETTSLTIKNTRARMILQNFSMNIAGTLSIENKSGRTDILSDVGDYSGIEKGGDVHIISEIGSFTFGTETVRYDIGGNLTIDTKNSYVTAGNIGGSVSQVSDSGALDVLTINEDLYINTDDSVTNVVKVLKGVEINSKYNTIEIGSIGQNISLLYQAVINLTNGNIVIGNAYYDLDITSTRGNVTVSNAFLDANIETTYGDINITYNAITSSIKSGSGSSVVYKTLNVTTIEGNIVANNIKAVTSLQVDPNSNASITANFLAINGNTFVKAGRREITVNVPFAEFNYEVKTKTGGVNILAGVTIKSTWLEADKNTELNIFTTGLIALDGNIATNTDVIIVSSTAGKINFTASIEE